MSVYLADETKRRQMSELVEYKKGLQSALNAIVRKTQTFEFGLMMTPYERGKLLGRKLWIEKQLKKVDTAIAQIKNGGTGNE